MTTGTFDRSRPAAWFATGNDVNWKRDWSGTDSLITKRPKSKPVYRTVRNPDGSSYRFRLLREGVDAPPKRQRFVDNPYSMGEVRNLNPTVDVKVSGVPYVSKAYHYLPPVGANPASILTTNDQLKCLGKLREKLTGSDFDMSVFLGEGHQTLKLIGDTAIRIAKSLHHLRRGDFAGTARSLLEGTSRKPIKPYKEMKPFKPTSERMSSHWLELQYGWLPLLNDVEGAAQTLAHTLSVPVQQTYRMSVRREQVVPGTAGTLIDGGRPTSEVSRMVIYALKVIVKEQPSQLAKLGLTDPTKVAWELMPWSFVVDWFIPIGDYLEARAITRVVHGTWVTSTFGKLNQYFVTLGGLSLRSQHVYAQVSLTRTVSTSPPDVPLPKVKPWKKIASIAHCLNAIALLGATVGRK
nr:MAG: hypothetical protein 1 [Leviviridae sp.]